PPAPRQAERDGPANRPALPVEPTRPRPPAGRSHRARRGAGPGEGQLRDGDRAPPPTEGEVPGPGRAEGHVPAQTPTGISGAAPGRAGGEVPAPPPTGIEVPAPGRTEGHAPAPTPPGIEVRPHHFVVPRS
ncbi:hypothetical protein ACFUMI_07990, partial [Streptomyces sp. NPDC057273]